MSNNFGAAAYPGRIRRALLFKNNSTIWCGIGGQAAWEDDLYPPEPVLSVLDIDTPIVYVQADIISMAVWSEEEADVVVAGNNYTLVSDEDAPENFARFIYLRFTLDGTIEGMPVGTFRQVGIFTDIVPTTGHESDLWLPPANVSSVGTLEYISNRRPVVFSASEVRMERCILEFK